MALFLEQLRVSRGISQEDFTEGIISNRQYQRYVNGSSAMPFHLLDEFAERLNIKKEFLLLEFDSYGIKETNNIVDYLNAVNSDDIEKAKTISQNIDPKYILDNTNLKFYEFTKLFQEFKEKKISKEQHIAKLKVFIDYPKILSSPAMTMVETLTLSTLLDLIHDDKEELKIFRKIKNFIDNPSLVWIGSQLITYNMLIFRIAKYSGMKRDFDNVIHFSKLAIALNLRAKYFLNLDYYYYFLSLAYYNKDDIALFEENLYRTFTVLEMVDIPTRLTKMLAIIKQDFNLDLVEFSINYQKKKYKLRGSN